MKNTALHIGCLTVSLALLLLLAGCASDAGGPLTESNKTVSCSKPYIQSGSNCCLDIDGNGICDVEENNTVQDNNSADTPPTTTTTIPDQDEQTVSGCDPIENADVLKPAAKTVKLCLSELAETEYGGYNLSIEKSDEGPMITVKGKGLTLGYAASGVDGARDITFGNSIIRLIGLAEDVNGYEYASVYAWTLPGGIECSKNSDCGSEDTIGYACLDSSVIERQYQYYRCASPGTILSKCDSVLKSESYKTCGGSEQCIQGDNRCFDKKCFDNQLDQDETGVDCGGSCAPCHCFNRIMDKGEESADCGGECMPCPEGRRDKSPPTVSITSPANILYNSRLLNFTFDVNESTSWCGYSINGGQNYTAKNGSQISAGVGANSIVVYCNDSYGNMGSGKAAFRVLLLDTQICPQDSVSEQYVDHFDSVVFYSWSDRELGSPDSCDPNVYAYSLTAFNDSEGLGQGINATNAESDKGFSDKPGALYYACTDAGRLGISYMVLHKNAAKKKPVVLKIIVYFSAQGSAKPAGSFWRVYAYKPGTDGIDEGRFIDVPYNPHASKCGRGLNISYQELDASSLIASGPKSLDLRLGYYTSATGSAIKVQEVELYTGDAGAAK